MTPNAEYVRAESLPKSSIVIAFVASCSAPGATGLRYHWGNDSACAERRVKSANAAHGFDLDGDRTKLTPKKIQVAGTFRLDRWTGYKLPTAADGAVWVAAWLRFALRSVYKVEGDREAVPLPNLRLSLREVTDPTPTHTDGSE